MSILPETKPSVETKDLPGEEDCAAMLTLYFTPGASSMAPHLALYEICAPFDARPVSLVKRENRSTEFLALNPAGTVPVLLIDGRPLSEVAAILFYLAKRFPAAGLLPESDLEGEAHAIEWMSFIASSIHPSRRLGATEARAVWDIAEQRLGGCDWAMGRYSIVDIHLFRLFWRFHGALELRPGELVGLQAHYERMRARPAVQQVLAAEAAIGYDALPGRQPPPL